MSNGTREKPIIFSAPMVRAILNGRKTQTRRIMKIQPDDDSRVDVGEIGDTRGVAYIRGSRGGQCVRVPCSYGQPGDRLYVKETFYAWGRWETRFNEKKGHDEWHFIDMTLESGRAYRYAASMPGDNGPRQRGSVTPQWWKRPAIFMPRAASRILLEIVPIRVERLQEISEEDAIAEGVFKKVGTSPVGDVVETHDGGELIYVSKGLARNAYHELWESINGPGSWDLNPYVWVIEFKRV